MKSEITHLDLKSGRVAFETRPFEMQVATGKGGPGACVDSPGGLGAARVAAWVVALMTASRALPGLAGGLVAAQAVALASVVAGWCGCNWTISAGARFRY